MALEVRKNRFAKVYENQFFRILAKKLVPLFEEMKISGVLLGSPVCGLNKSLQIDVLLVTETAVIIIDLKKYGGKIKLPSHGPNNPKVKNCSWWKQKWTLAESGKEVTGGSGKNPFHQVAKQVDKLNRLTQRVFIERLNKDENYEGKDIQRIVCFHESVSLVGSIDPRYSHNFHICDPSNIINQIADIINVAPNDWNPNDIKGFKLSDNAFNLFKENFKTDKFNPLLDNEMYLEEEFDQIDYSTNEDSSFDELVEEEYKSLKPDVESFFESAESILKIEADNTSGAVGFVNHLLADFFEGDEEGNTYSVLAPTNKHVADLIALGAPGETQSLYGKLYDFENTTIELLHNAVNEREVFPLCENKDGANMCYIVFNAHLIYDFSSNEDDLVKFGSGSLCNDTLDFVTKDRPGCKLILINDPYFYGHDATTITSDELLAERELNFKSIGLRSKPISDNDKSVMEIVSNINNQEFNKLKLSSNENLCSLKGGTFKEKIQAEVASDKINHSIILAKEKQDSANINSWVRKLKGVKGPGIVEGDLILIKNRVLVPEVQDPFAIPKYLNSGDIAEVLDIESVEEFKSSKYSYSIIPIVRCNVYLQAYETERMVYLIDNSMNYWGEKESRDSINGLQELKKHIQIRKKEIIDDYMEELSVGIKNLLSPTEYEQYQKELEEIKSDKGLFEDDQIALDDSELQKRINRLNADWKINKRKLNYAKSELLKDVNSEYFKLSEAAYYTYSWSIPIKNSYGYTFNNTYLANFPLDKKKISKRIERLHQFLYSGLIASKELSYNGVLDINPWSYLDFKEVFPTEKTKSKNTILISLQSQLIDDQKTNDIINQYALNDKPNELVNLARWVLNKLEEHPNVKLNSIKSHKFLEKYYFEYSGEKEEVLFDYNGKFQVKPPRVGNSTEGNQFILSLFSEEIITEPLHINPNENWRAYHYKELADRLVSKCDISITGIATDQFKDIIKFSGAQGGCSIELIYNQKGMFTYMKFNEGSSVEIQEVLLNEMKTFAEC